MDKPKYASIIDSFLDSREPDWKDLGLKDAKNSGDEWLERTHAEADKGFLDELAEGSGRTAQARTAGNGGEDDSLVAEITESFEEAAKGGKVEKKHRSDNEIKNYIKQLLNQGVPPARVAAQLKKLAELELFNHQMGTRYLQDNAGLLGMAYMEPNTFMDKSNPNYERTASSEDKKGKGYCDECGKPFKYSEAVQGKENVCAACKKSKKAYGFNTQHELKQQQETGGLISQIRAGDRVTIRTSHGQEQTGKAVMYNAQQQCWVLNMGGKHGTPGIADEENIVKVRKARTTPRQASNKTATTYKVDKKPGGRWWYIFGLPKEESNWETNEKSQAPDSFIIPGMNHGLSTPEGLMLGIYESLYDEFQMNDNLHDGDVFETPVGKFVCQGIHVLPYDDQTKQKLQEAAQKEEQRRQEDSYLKPTSPKDREEWNRLSKEKEASSQDCVRQARAWKAAGIQPRAKSVKQITACADCTYFKKNGSSKSCGLYGLPVVGNAKELTSIVNKLTAGVPAESKKAALVQIANRLPEQNIPKAASVESPFVRQASFTKEREYGFKEAEHFSGAKVQKLHAAGHSLKTIYAAAEKKFGTLETSKAVREFIASLSTDKGKIIMASADAEFLKKIGIHNEAIVGAAKCASCKSHKAVKEYQCKNCDHEMREHKDGKCIHSPKNCRCEKWEKVATASTMVTRAPETFVQATPMHIRSTQNKVVANFDSAAVAKYHTAGHSVEKIFKAASAKYGSAQASKAIRDWAQNLKNTNTKVALSQIDCTTLTKMGVKLSSQNAIIGAEKCGSCSYRNGMHCGLTGGTLLSFPGMNQITSNKKVASGAPEDGRSILKEFDLMGKAEQADIDMTTDRDYDVK